VVWVIPLFWNVTYLFLDCQSGIWKTQLGSTQVITASSIACGVKSACWPGYPTPSIAMCPVGTKVLSGGYVMVSVPADGNWGDGYTAAPETSAPVQFYHADFQSQYPVSLPDDPQGWFVWAGTAENAGWKALAFCTGP
jgi:hypothetical protein